MIDELPKKAYAYLPVWDTTSDSANKIGFMYKDVENMTVEEKAYVAATTGLDWRNKEHAETCRKELVKLIGENPF